MAPPFGFNFSFGIPTCSMVIVACEAKASLTSKMSMSEAFSPAFSNADGIAKAGPMPMSLGSTPTHAKLRIRAKMGRPNAFAALRRAMRIIDAPSDIWLAFPAVVDPPSLKTGFNFAKLSIVVPSRGPSSAATVTGFTLPSFCFTMAVKGTISESNQPFFCAATAFAFDSTAIRSCTSREIPYFAATFSDVTPMGMRHAAANSCFSTLGLVFDITVWDVIGYMDMDSTPPAMPTSITPVLMLAAMFAAACKLLAHCRFTPATGMS
mmetsp:Transcript_114490/g.318435  ORF Transcript_114490/g.318435 Transcript_114490/m.318435 type:complete len:265 (+) Transcript_114490:426-1220(+)